MEKRTTSIKIWWVRHPLILNPSNIGGVAIGASPATGHGLTIGGSVYSVSGYHKEGFDNNSILLAGGGSKFISDFVGSNGGR